MILRKCRAGHCLDKLNLAFERNNNENRKLDGTKIKCDSFVCGKQIDVLNNEMYYRCTVKDCNYDYCSECVGCPKCQHVIAHLNSNASE